MTKSQIGAIAGAVVLFFVLYLGFDTIPPKQKDLEKSRSFNLESTGVTNLIQDAQKKLTQEQISITEALNLDLEKSAKDTLKRIQILKSLSGTWYEMGFPSIAGAYAEDLAFLEKTKEAWSMAGTTYAICVKSSEDAKVKDFCSKRAIKSFENAISIDPENVESRINLAICYVDNPDQGNPMKGILMLRELNSKYPENVSVLNQLGKLALQTNQTDKAIERLETAIKLDPKNQNTICLLASAYKNAGDITKSDEYQKKCIN
ncbi:MAG: tetratricopeptide repeat protein [Saprospiraceae bacterium]